MSASDPKRTSTSVHFRRRRGLRRLGFLNGLCGCPDYVQHSMRLGEHRNVTEAQLDGCGAHALRNETVQFGLTVRSSVATTYQLGLDRQAMPSTFCVNRSGTGTAWVAQTSFCSASGRSPAKQPMPSGFNQIRPSATSMWEKTSVTGNFCYWLCEVSVSTGASAAM